MRSLLPSLAMMLASAAQSQPRYQLSEHGGGLGLWVDRVILF